jgi:hypothetical protein
MKEECIENFIGTIGQKHLKQKQNPFMAINRLIHSHSDPQP